MDHYRREKKANEQEVEKYILLEAKRREPAGLLTTKHDAVSEWGSM